jgi:hypothetical protein
MYIYVYRLTRCEGCLVPNDNTQIELRDGETVAVDWHVIILEELVDQDATCVVNLYICVVYLYICTYIFIYLFLYTKYIFIDEYEYIDIHSYMYYTHI